MDELRGVRVLLIDDDEDTRTLYEMALGEAGAEVRSAADGAEAMRSVAEWRPGIIVSDLVMPGTNVVALLREVRALYPSKRIPAVAVSGRSSTQDREDALASGFQEHAGKPLIPHDLVNLVRRSTSTP
jgi:CheY-like chemotaxis protein